MIGLDSGINPDIQQWSDDAAIPSGPFTISVQNNSDLALVPGITGDGSAGTPYVIANMSIDAGGVGSAILINNTNAHLVIYNCTVTNAGSVYQDAGIRLINATNVNVSSNQAVGNQYNGITVSDYSHGCIITGNNASNNAERGIDVSSNNCVITGNTVVNNSYAGITVFPGYNNTITGNEVIDSSTGIFYRNADNTTITGNNVSLCINGIHSHMSDYAFVSENNIFQNQDGFYVGMSALYIIERNDIFLNTQDGLSTLGEGNGTIYRNTISGNGRYGMYLESVDYDLIYFNTLAGNPVNAGITACTEITGTIT